MSSINTNVSAMQALQSLNNTNQALQETQNRISTGFKVGNAKDNAAIWSVAQVMRSDVSGFGAISEQLSLGESTVAVARNASETVSDLIGQIKERVISAQGDNVDREKIQNDIDELVGQVQSVVDAAQFNGSNLLKDTSGAAEFDVLSSLDRASDQTVTASRINVSQTNLSTSDDDSIVKSDTAAVANNDSTTSAATYTVNVDDTQYTSGGIEEITVQFNGSEFKVDSAAADAAGDGNGTTTMAELASALQTALDGEVTGTTAAFSGSGPSTLTITAGDTVSTIDGVSFRGSQVGLASLSEIDVRSSESAKHALGMMEGFTQDAIDAAANFGSAQMRIETQMDFVSKLSDSLEAGVGSLVDANMTEESAKLNALQVQQQLGTQALSIANQSPQNLLSLFR